MFYLFSLVRRSVTLSEDNFILSISAMKTDSQVTTQKVTATRSVAVQQYCTWILYACLIRFSVIQGEPATAAER
jgi:hypothetical protein